MKENDLQPFLEDIKKAYLETEMTLDEIGVKWNTSRYVIARLLKKHKIKKPYRTNLIGKKFGNLTVIQFLGSKDSSGIWKCQCGCGGTKNVPTKQLNYGVVQSCGCLQKEVARKHLKSILKPLNSNTLAHWIIAGYKHRAKRKQIVFNLSLQDCQKLFSQNCFYCGSQPNQFKTNKTGLIKFFYNGIDRIDNEKGYQLDNVVSCCGICNRAKGTLTQKEFLTWAQKLDKLHL